MGAGIYPYRAESASGGFGPSATPKLLGSPPLPHLHPYQKMQKTTYKDEAVGSAILPSDGAERFKESTLGFPRQARGDRFEP
jgi:hypothetical protein